MDRLGDLSQFDESVIGPWRVKAIFYEEGLKDVFCDHPQYRRHLIAERVAARNAALIAGAPDLLAALKESRKEVEELRGNARRAKTILQEEIESIEQEDGGRGCVTAMIDAIVELEGKQ